MWQTMEHTQGALRRTVFAGLTLVVMAAPAGRPLVPTYAPAQMAGAARTALKVRRLLSQCVLLPNKLPLFLQHYKVTYLFYSSSVEITGIIFFSLLLNAI